MSLIPSTCFEFNIDACIGNSLASRFDTQPGAFMGASNSAASCDPIIFGYQIVQSVQPA